MKNPVLSWVILPMAALWTLGPAHAQNSVKVDGVERQTPVQRLMFHSVLTQYKPYTEEKASAWKAANDEVARIGGWRTYLKEAQEPESVEPPVKPTTSPTAPVSPTTPTLPSVPVPSRTTNPHSGHGSK